MSKKYHYVYRITNIYENKYYYGVRSCKCLPKKDLGINYFSSSKNKIFIKEQKEKPEMFKYKIVSVYKTRRLAALKEMLLHEKFDVGVNDSFYNKAKHTSTGFDVTGRHWTLSEKTKQKMSMAQSGQNNPMFGRKYSDEEKRKMSKKNSGERNSMFGKTHSEETKQKMSDIAIKTKRIAGKNNPMFGSNRINEKNPFFGKIHSEETKKRISLANKGKYVGSKKYVNKDNKIIQCFEDDSRLKFGEWQRGIQWK